MVWNVLKFPNMAITFMGKNARTRLRDNQYVFRVEPNYTKHDIKEYLTKIYGLPVVKVNTMNYEGACAHDTMMACVVAVRCANVAADWNGAVR